jgi:S-adenosylmethionine-diacylglycerol 3-amino-3-carboxypropyl transferase
VSAIAPIADRADFGIVRYANCWEDADVLVEALAASARGGRVLSIASAGDNVLALLTQAPELIVAVDLSAAQLACLELRMVGFANLEHPELLAFLGVSPCARRADTYRLLRTGLSQCSRGFWDQHARTIEHGVIHGGKFERYFGYFRALLPLIHSKRCIEEVLEPKTAAQRRQFYAQRWNTWTWRAVAKIFFSRRLIGWLGRDPSFFEHVDGSVANHVLARAQHGVTELDANDNPYLRYIVTGGFEPCLPLYLREEQFAQIRDGLDRIRIVRGDLTDVGQRYGDFSAFNLSDIFEYMDEATFTGCAGWLASAAVEEATLAYWNMLVPRSLACTLPTAFHHQRERSADLHRRDKAFFYRALHVDTRATT